MDNIAQPSSLQSSVDRRFAQLRRRDPAFAQEVLQEAALIAAEKGSTEITDSIASSAQRRLRETVARHGGQPSRRQRARGEEFCNRSPMVYGVGYEGQTLSIFDALLAEMELSDSGATIAFKNAGSIYDIDLARLSDGARALLQIVAEHADQMRKIEIDTKLTKRQRNQKVQGIQRKFASAVSEIAPTAKAELDGALELEREAAGLGRLCEKTVNNTQNPNSLISRTDRKLQIDNGPYNAFKRWELDKRKLAAKFWADAFAGKLAGADGFLVWPEPIQPDSAIVIRRYKERGWDLDDYLPFPNRITDEQRAEDAASWYAYLDSMPSHTQGEDTP